MFIELDKIKQLEVELSTYCNAACPGCSRHYWGTSDKLPNLVEEHLDVDDVTKVIKQIPNINEFKFKSITHPSFHSLLYPITSS